MPQLRKVLGLESVKDSAGNIIKEAPLPVWANLRQRALDTAIKEINEKTDLYIALESLERAQHRRITTLIFGLRKGKLTYVRDMIASAIRASGLASFDFVGGFSGQYLFNSPNLLAMVVSEKQLPALGSGIWPILQFLSSRIAITPPGLDMNVSPCASILVN